MAGESSPHRIPPQSATFDTKAEAEDWAATVEAEMIEGRFVNRRHLADCLVADIIKKYREEVTPSKRGAGKETTRLRQLETMRFAKLRLDLVEVQDGREFRDQRLKQVAAGTVIREMNLLSSVFNYARSEWKEYRGLTNPFEKVKRPKSPPSRDRRLLEEGDEMGKRLVNSALSG